MHISFFSYHDVKCEKSVIYLLFGCARCCSPLSYAHFTIYFVWKISYAHTFSPPRPADQYDERWGWCSQFTTRLAIKKMFNSVFFQLVLFWIICRDRYMYISIIAWELCSFARSCTLVCEVYGEFRVQLTWHSRLACFALFHPPSCSRAVDWYSVLALETPSSLFFTRSSSSFLCNFTTLRILKKNSRVVEDSSISTFFLFSSDFNARRMKLHYAHSIAQSSSSPCSMHKNFELLTIQSINFIRSLFSSFQIFLQYFLQQTFRTPKEWRKHITTFV